MVKFKRKKPTVSAYGGQIVSFSPPSLGKINNSQSSSSVATVKHNNDHPVFKFGYPESPQQFTFCFECPMTLSKQLRLADEMQQDSSGSREYTNFKSAEESDATLAHPVLRIHFYPKYISV